MHNVTVAGRRCQAAPPPSNSSRKARAAGTPSRGGSSHPVDDAHRLPPCFGHAIKDNKLRSRPLPS